MQHNSTFHQELFETLSRTKSEFHNFNSQSGNHVEYSQEAKRVYDMVIASEGFEWGRYCDTPLNSIAEALLSSAKTGLTFDSERGFAFLKCVFDPRIGEFVTRFDFGYKGFLMLAARSGLVKLVTADVVYDNDLFKFNGTRKAVTHEVTALSPAKRGSFAGGYCTSELNDEAIITTVMTPEEINSIEYEAKKNAASAWNTVFVDELRRKTLIRRHWKTLSTTLQGLTSMPALNHVDKLIQDEDEISETNQSTGLGGVIDDADIVQRSY